MSQTIVTISSDSPQSQLSEMLSDLVETTLKALETIEDHDLRFNAHCDLCKALEQPNVIQSLCEVQGIATDYNLILFT
jgi:hypothetical protein